LHQLTTASKNYRSSKGHNMKSRNVTAEGHVNLGLQFTPTLLYSEFGEKLHMSSTDSFYYKLYYLPLF
jgi:hypothetical protein